MRAGQSFGAEHAGPDVEGQVTGENYIAALAPLAEDPEQQHGANWQERHVSQLVDDRQL